MLDIGMPSWIKYIFAAIATCGTHLFGGADTWVYALITFVILDYTTGLMAAYYNHALSSKKGREGFVRKIALFAIVAVANVIDNAMELHGVIRTVIICFFVANEGLSVLENCAKMGLPVPQKLIDALEQIKQKNQK
jgi:toxin secretion/phage lysis holin